MYICIAVAISIRAIITSEINKYIILAGSDRTTAAALPVYFFISSKNKRVELQWVKNNKIALNKQNNMIYVTYSQ